jgi:hypothetical protein|nr:MAG TPA: Protein of unknown function (DUF3987) [Caudoviricetes sp.]
MSYENIIKVLNPNAPVWAVTSATRTTTMNPKQPYVIDRDGKPSLVRPGDWASRLYDLLDWIETKPASRQKNLRIGAFLTREDGICILDVKLDADGNLPEDVAKMLADEPTYAEYTTDRKAVHIWGYEAVKGLDVVDHPSINYYTSGFVVVTGDGYVMDGIDYSTFPIGMGSLSMVANFLGANPTEQDRINYALLDAPQDSSDEDVIKRLPDWTNDIALFNADEIAVFYGSVGAARAHVIRDILSISGNVAQTVRVAMARFPHVFDDRAKTLLTVQNIGNCMTIESRHYYDEVMRQQSEVYEPYGELFVPSWVLEEGGKVDALPEEKTPPEPAIQAAEASPKTVDALPAVPDSEAEQEELFTGAARLSGVDLYADIADTPFGRAITEMSQRITADGAPIRLSYLIGAMLGVASGLLGRRYTSGKLFQHRQVGSLYVSIVGAPGVGKSSSFSPYMRLVGRELDKEIKGQVIPFINTFPTTMTQFYPFAIAAPSSCIYVEDQSKFFTMAKLSDNYTTETFHDIMRFRFDAASDNVMCYNPVRGGKIMQFPRYYTFSVVADTQIGPFVQFVCNREVSSSGLLSRILPIIEQRGPSDSVSDDYVEPGTVERHIYHLAHAYLASNRPSEAEDDGFEPPRFIELQCEPEALELFRHGLSVYEKVPSYNSFDSDARTRIAAHSAKIAHIVAAYNAVTEDDKPLVTYRLMRWAMSFVHEMFMRAVPMFNLAINGDETAIMKRVLSMLETYRKDGTINGKHFQNRLGMRVLDASQWQFSNEIIQKIFSSLGTVAIGRQTLTTASVRNLLSQGRGGNGMLVESKRQVDSVTGIMSSCWTLNRDLILFPEFHMPTLFEVINK